MKIDLMFSMDPPFGPLTHEEEGIGGSENFATYVAEYLALAGHQVRMYNKASARTVARSRETGITWEWLPLGAFDRDENRDVFMTFRSLDGLRDPLPHTRWKVIALADTESYGLGDAVRDGQVDQVLFVSRWQAQKICIEERLNVIDHLVGSNGVSMRRFDLERENIRRLPYKCIHLSTPERGLKPLLRIWPMIQSGVPEAELHLFCSFRGWRTTEEQDEEMSREYYDAIEELQSQGLNIFNHKHCDARAMRTHLLSSRLFLYPTEYFNETCCICAIEAAAAGVPIVCTARAALKERVLHGQTGYLIDEGESHDWTFADRAVGLLKDPSWHSMSGQSVVFARQFDYAELVRTWTKVWQDAITIRGRL